jgi:DnaJ domain
MQYLLFGTVALLLLMVAARGFVVANPAALARQMRTAGGVVALGMGGILLLRGMATFGMWALAIGTWLLMGAGQIQLPNWGRRWTSRPADPKPSSRVVTEHLDVALEHETGAIRGRVLKGFFRERDLETLRPVELAHLWSDCQFADPQSAHILEAYLDRIHPTWRDDMARTAPGGDAHAGSQPSGQSGTMSRLQALDILGLADGATEEDIRRAHRILMLKLHPDRGGSHTLAAKVNEAKDVLLERR